MPWGKIDDAFDDDPRTLRVLANPEGPQALGLHLVCFAWANRYTRRKGRTPGLLPYQLPLAKMGPHAYGWAQLLVDEELWAHADPARPEAGWVICDFAESLPDEDVRRKRADAGRLGAAKRWGTPAAQASPSSTRTPSDQRVHPAGEGDTPGPDPAMALCYTGDSKCHDLPMATSGLLSVCHPDPTNHDGKVPSPDGTLLPNDDTLPSPEPGETGRDPSGYGTLPSRDGSLPRIDGTLLHGGSKTAPHTHTHTQEQKKTLSAPDGAGVLDLPLTPAPALAGKRAKTTPRADVTPEFERFWATYGRRGAKPAAAAAWHKALTLATAEQIMAAVPAYLAANPEPRYRKHAERWLRDQMWLSATPPPPRPTGAPFHNPAAASAYETSI